MSQKPEIEIDGRNFGTLDEFAAEFSARVLKGHVWSGNLDAFNDLLRGGFGTPTGAFVLVWKNSELSRERLGHEETARVLERRLTTAHPLNRQSISANLERARNGHGPTVFEWLIQIIRDHGPGGAAGEDQVELRLE